MSKKSKRQKIKKKLRALLRQQMAEAEQKKINVSFDEKIPEPEIKPVPEKPVEANESPVVSEKADDTETEEPLSQNATLTQRLNPFFAADIKKVILAILISLALIIGLFFISRDTNWLKLAAEKLFQLLHLRS